ncbi:hypothetical protein G6N05_12050 [Flavobacterium sp. F372]|uniref:Uncharacterized protein n=1 Tax=Flavobacterium bernardetii TaxID=2813823 RepID=A0ABR7IZA9_9FLAO|nr:hypothetical protein [Flavobacterium bernardetii]MBC5835043.1 hypothetical protein [Flavobacterium bernardetii]NHF70841.1 hypothetical protein [Flavobacterium bernardetii]
MINKWISINALVSISMFAYIFYTNLGVSGGDMAIIALNIIFGIFQIIMIAIFTKSTNDKKHLILLTVVILQIIELLVFLKWGFSISKYLSQ